MGYQLKKPVLLAQLSEALDLEVVGPNALIREVSAYSSLTKNCLSFSKNVTNLVEKSVLITFEDQCSYELDNLSYILSNNPRLDFIRVLNFLQDEIGFSTWSEPSYIHPSAIIGKNVVIEDGCRVGENTVIEHNVVLHSGTRIGNNSRIRSCSSIGGDGFGYERLKNGVPIRFPHLGGVLIGDNVEIGALNSISCGALSDTVIKNNVKTDNLVHIAHNCIIDESVLITACAELSGGVTVGKDAWIGPNVSIMQKVSIGEDALIGLGAVVTKNVPISSIFAGNPAKKIRDK
tara:strand:- start:5007 stop:5876 length:870 start_codon:yes stop_codon:yes gene_type:complete